MKPAYVKDRQKLLSRLNRVEGHKLWFDVECHEGEKLCGTGTHRRMIVPAWPR